MQQLRTGGLPLLPRAAVQIVTAGALALALTSCSSTPPASPPAAPDTAASSPAGEPAEADGDYAIPHAAATWDQASADTAAQAATTAMTVFISHSPDPQAWWAQLQPLLSPTAARDYAGVDPANVPARRLTGPAQVQADASAYLATALVPTDHGAYTVLLSRQGGDQPWLVERLTPPPGAEPGARL